MREPAGACLRWLPQMRFTVAFHNLRRVVRHRSGRRDRRVVRRHADDRLRTGDVVCHVDRLQRGGDSHFEHDQSPMLHFWFCREPILAPAG